MTSTILLRAYTKVDDTPTYWYANKHVNIKTNNVCNDAGEDWCCVC